MSSKFCPTCGDPVHGNRIGECASCREWWALPLADRERELQLIDFAMRQDALDDPIPLVLP